MYRNVDIQVGEFHLEYFYGESYRPTSVTSCETRCRQQVKVTLYIEAPGHSTGIVEWNFKTSADGFYAIEKEVVHFCVVNARRIWKKHVVAEEISHKHGSSCGRYGFNERHSISYKLIF